MILEISELIGDSKANLKLTELVDILVSHPHLETNSSKIFSDSSIYISLIHVGKIIGYLPNQIDYNLFVIKNFQNFIANGLLTLFENKHILNFNINIGPDKAEEATFLNEKRILTLSYLLFITGKLIYYSDKFVDQLVNGNGLKNHFLFLSNKDFIENNHTSTLNNLYGSYNFFNLIFTNILNISIKCVHKKIWIEINSNEILLKASNLTKNNTNIFISYLIVLHTNTVDQLEKVHARESIKDLLINTIVLSGNDFKTNNFNRSKFKFRYFDEPIEFESQLIQCDTYLYLSVVDLLECLSKLCFNNEIRMDVYFKMENTLKQIFENGNLVEVFFSLHLLDKLCLSKDVCFKMGNNKTLCKILTKLIYVIDIKESKESINSKKKKLYGYMQNIAKQIKLNLIIAISK